MKIAIFGLGYVGMAYATLLCSNNQIDLIDKDEDIIQRLTNKDFSNYSNSAKEKLIDNFNNLSFFTTKQHKNFTIDLVIIATSTNEDVVTHELNTKSIEEVISTLSSSRVSCPIIIKSTVPVGYTNNLKNKMNHQKIYFSPEFLKETTAYEDVLNPSRIVIGEQNDDTALFVKLLINETQNNPPVMYVTNEEAEAIKLFSNTYLAMRLAFFNELDQYAEAKGLDAKKLIEGLGYDERIGMFYNHPSFGFGGSCLPKDSKQLEKMFGNIPHPLISAIQDSNQKRKEWISSIIDSKKPDTIGIYRLVSKKGGPNFRESAMIDMFILLKKQGRSIFIFEPLIAEQEYLGCRVIKTIDEFKDQSKLIVTNFMDVDLLDVQDKVYTRDVF